MPKFQPTSRSSTFLSSLGKPGYLLLLGLFRFVLWIGHCFYNILLTSLIFIENIISSVRSWSSSVHIPHRHPPVLAALHVYRKKKKPGRKKLTYVIRVEENILPPFFVWLGKGGKQVFRTFWFHLPFLITLIIVIGGFAGGSYAFYVKILKDLPAPSALREHQPEVTTKIYDRNGTLLYKFYKDQNRSMTTIDKIPQALKDATISMEDKEFYSHKGISVRGILRAADYIFQTGKIQGGSTITQQLIKNTLLSPEQTLTRKIKEAILAVQVESMMSKDQILEMYFNEVPLGGTVYGVEEASETYFGKPVQDLDLAQSAYLAGMIAAPSAYSAYGSAPENGIARQHEVLTQMVEDEKISPIQAEQARAEILAFTPPRSDIKAPHFVMYIRDLLAKQYGEDALTQGGLEVTTTLDLPTQDSMQETVSAEVTKLASLKVSNGAALMTNPNTGEILAMVGSRDYFDTKHDGQVNVTTRPRQPGSSIKPLMYAAAFERGLTPATTIDDSPVSYSVPGSPVYAPRNYDGSFHGTVTVRRALASSYNVPAVKTLASIGVDSLVQKAKQMGITTWDDSSRFGLSLTLGGGEVLMTDMATAFGTFANQGMTVPLQPFLRITDYRGNVLYENKCIETTSPCGGKRTLDSRIAYQITNILSDNEARAPAFGLHSVLEIPGQQVAVKTGTTNGLRDNWTIGFTTKRLVAVWVGNNDNSQMSRVTSGITGASPIWSTIIRTQLDPNSPNSFPTPDNLATITMCRDTSRPTCGGCGHEYKEYFLPGTQPDTQCSSTNEFVTQDEEQSLQVALPSPQVVASQDKILDGATSP